MSMLRRKIEDEFGPVESVAKNGKYEVVKDRGGDHWIGRRLITEEVEYTLLDEHDRDLPDFLASLADADLIGKEVPADE